MKAASSASATSAVVLALLTPTEEPMLAGFTPISMYPKMWQASGLSYTDLIDELVGLALARHANRRRATNA